MAAYREAYGYHREDDPIGPAPGRGNVEARAAWQAAYSALEAPEADRMVAARDEGELRNLVRAYEREEAWAPAHVDDELREASLASREHYVRLVTERAEVDAMPDGDARAQAAQRLADHEELRRRLAKRTDDLDEIARARSAWYAETASARELADRGRSELRRRTAEGTAEERVHEDHSPAEDRAPEQRTVARGEEHEQAEALEGHDIAADDVAPDRIPSSDLKEPPEPGLQAELLRAREAVQIVATREAERRRAEAEAQAERDRDYARRLGDDRDYEVELDHGRDDFEP